MTELLVLAGGKGTRFFPFSALIPKCLAPVAGKPCVRWIVEDAFKQGFQDVILCVNRKDEMLFRHEFRDLDIRFSVSEAPKGTVAEVVNADPRSHFILKYGDDLTQVNYESLLGFHVVNRAKATLAVTTKFELPVGVVETGDGVDVISFDEKPFLPKPIWVGVAVFDVEMLSYFMSGDVAKDVFPKMLVNHEKICAYETGNEWFDVGNIEHFRLADAYYMEAKL